MDYPLCDRSNCINWNNGHCSLKDPEKDEDSCLHFDDKLDNLRLKADAIKGTLA
ncbi:MAG: hypothetical protein IAX21_04405 [Candidatus Bathyarchaeota archaeon]|nr:hypothetical protein [Candidatus Bathyarchaeum tardum]WGM89802.1 MAG: hypothetical protein NUK63_01375 [Candidatus Bathyarchaeum tardum]WNZ30100.1 MAG: hypothetical protein IAX21_04405 [Candidatus Bathyarchaeota archaeon]